jgi:hypothetical protein
MNAASSNMPGVTASTGTQTTVRGQTTTQSSGSSGTVSRTLDSCSQNCVAQNVKNPQLYSKFFQLLSQSEYSTVCNEITNLQTCVTNCAPNCLIATLPMYTQSCSVGYQNFTNLYDCMNAMASTYNTLYTQCQQQCNSNSNSINSRARRQTGNVANANSNVFCITECGMNQELPLIQNKCTPFVVSLSRFLSQTYQNLASGSPQCLNTNIASN